MKIIVKKCVSLVFVLLTIAMLCMCAAFFVACDDEPTSDTFDETQSRLLGIDEAYDLGLLTDDDLMSIAYYYHDSALGNGREYNEIVIREDFVPAAKEPELLRSDVFTTIESAYAEVCDETRVEANSPFKPHVVAYCGTYGKCVVVTFRDDRLSEEPYFGIETDKYYPRIEAVGGLRLYIGARTFPLVWYIGDGEPSDLTYPGISLEFDALAETYGNNTDWEQSSENFIAICDTYEQMLDAFVSHGFDAWEDESIEEYMTEHAGEKSLVVCSYVLAADSGPYSIDDIKTDGDTLTLFVYHESRNTANLVICHVILIAGVDSSAVSDVTNFGTVSV